MRKIVFVAGFAVAALLHGPVTAQETDFVSYAVQVEELERRWGDEGERHAAWDADAYVGTDELKLRWLGSGEYDIRSDKLEKAENRLVLQAPVSDFFDVKAGIRADTPKGTDRWYGVVGLTGLAQQWIEVDADLFLSERGDLSARLDAEYELLLTNRLILTPSADLDFAFSDDRAVGTGTGLSRAEVGLRLRYDVVDRAFSPYLGAVWERKFGRTADFARDEGEDVEAWFFVAGVRLMF
jgi:copper resistance protein B